MDLAVAIGTGTIENVYGLRSEGLGPVSRHHVTLLAETGLGHLEELLVV